MKDRNENRPGYKKTKVGWIPEEWQSGRFSDIAYVMMGQSPDGKSYNKNRYGVPLINGPSEFTKRYPARKQWTTKPTKICKSEDILLCVRGSSTGRINIANDTYCIGRGIAAIREKESISCYLFIEHTLYAIKNRIVRYSSGSTFPNIDRKTLLNIPIAIPPLPKQKKIADILSAWDEAIEQMRKLIDAKKRRKKALMQQLLTGKRRLRGFEKTKDQKRYRFFDLPEDWECPQMKEIAQECSERNILRGDLPVLACSKYLGFVESSEYFGKRVFSEDTSNYKLIRRGWFGFPSNHIEEGSIGLLLNRDIGLVSPIYIVFKCDESVIPEYLYAVFKTDTFKHIFKVSTNASVDRRGSLRWREFALIYVPKPSREEQQAIVDILQSADEEIDKHEMKLNALEKQKCGLMQKLLTGEVRVKL
jgi:restriction endonuclease S subunit